MENFPLKNPVIRPSKQQGYRNGKHVKIHIDMAGKPLAEQDFAKLRAGISAAQATTPTAAASDRAHAQLDPTEALTRLFGDEVAGAAEKAALHGSFNPASARDEEGGAEK